MWPGEPSESTLRIDASGPLFMVPPHWMIGLKSALAGGRWAVCLQPLLPFCLLFLPITPDADQLKYFRGVGWGSTWPICVRVHAHHFSTDPQLQIAVADELERQFILAIAALPLEAFVLASCQGRNNPKLQFTCASRYTSLYNVLASLPCFCSSGRRSSIASR